MENELIKIELSPAHRIKLSEQIRTRMEALGYPAYDYDKLDTGLKLGPAWPADRNSVIEMGQLVVLCMKLKLTLTIHDYGIDLTPM